MCAAKSNRPCTGPHALALASGCFLSGAMFCISIIMIPTILDTNTETGGLVAHWARLYHYGSMMLPSIAVTTTAIYLYASASFSGKKRVRCAAAGGLTLAIIPFTLCVMSPTNNALFAMNDSVSGAGSTYEKSKARDLIMRWTMLHTVRSLMPLVGAAVGLLGTAEAEEEEKGMGKDGIARKSLG